MKKRKIQHIVNPATKEWYHIDENYLVHTCNCMEKEYPLSLCLSVCSCLKLEGDLREVEREIAVRRKELGLLHTVKMEDIQELMNKK